MLCTKAYTWNKNKININKTDSNPCHMAEISKENENTPFTQLIAHERLFDN